MPKTNLIDRDDLIGVARKAESLTTMLADIEQEFFGTTNYKDSLLIDAERIRRYIGTCFDISRALTVELHEKNIWCYSKEAA